MKTTKTTLNERVDGRRKKAPPAAPVASIQAKPTPRMRMPRVTPTVSDAAPHAPAQFSQWQQIALRAVAEGKATPEQQIAALEWIVYQNCRAYDVSFRLGSADGTAFAEGRRFPALQIIRLLTIPVIEDAPGSPSFDGPQTTG